MITLHTNFGDIEVELNSEKAPNTCANFLEYANAGFYDGTIFHRVIDGFMIQGGGFDKDMNQKAVNAPIENEATSHGVRAYALELSTAERLWQVSEELVGETFDF